MKYIHHFRSQLMNKGHVFGDSSCFEYHKYYSKRYVNLKSRRSRDSWMELAHIGIQVKTTQEHFPCMEALLRVMNYINEKTKNEDLTQEEASV